MVTFLLLFFVAISSTEALLYNQEDLDQAVAFLVQEAKPPLEWKEPTLLKFAEVVSLPPAIITALDAFNFEGDTFIRADAKVFSMLLKAGAVLDEDYLAFYRLFRMQQMLEAAIPVADTNKKLAQIAAAQAAATEAAKKAVEAFEERMQWVLTYVVGPILLFCLCCAAFVRYVEEEKKKDILKR